MSIPTQGALFGIGAQTAKGTIALNTPSAYHRFRTNRVSYGLKSEDQNFPFQIGGGIVTPGVFKTGVSANGDVELFTTLDGSLGVLLKAYMGAATSQAGGWDETTNTSETDAGAATPIADVYTHSFTFNPAGDHLQPWMTTRLFMPGVAADGVTPKNYGEQHANAKVTSLNINIPQAGLLTANMSVIGILDEAIDTMVDTTGWAWANDFDENSTAAHAAVGHFKIAGVEYPVTNVTIQLASQTSFDKEQVVGKYYRDDLILLNRTGSIRFMYKWQNADLYRTILSGSNDVANWGNWSPLPFIQDTNTTGSAVAYALDASFGSAGFIDGDPAKGRYTMKLLADRIAWRIDPRGIELGPQDIIMVPFVGELIAPATGDEFLKIVLVNEVASY